ncbi:MAG TPA: RsmG family class I SAM-dependent methyltransferase, partial [Candidatus Obscuribacterales bacterium]
MKDCGQIFDELERRALMLGVQLTDAQRQQILSFAGLLAAYNEHTNLVSRADLATLVLEHALDSLSLIAPIKVILQEKECSQPFPLADIGSGGGFPAMIVAIMMPMAEITMFEAV